MTVNRIAYLAMDGPLEEQDQAGNEVVDHALQAETDADTERTGEDGHLRQVHSQHC